MLAFDDAPGKPAVEEEEENYFVSMTDMMVGILFIFIIMLMVFALQFQKQTDESEEQADKSKVQIEEVLEKVRQVSEQLHSLRSEINEELEDLSQSQRERTALLNDLERELKATGLDVQIDRENGVLRLTENAIRFATDKSNLSAQAADNVRKLAAVLARVLPRYTSCVVSSGATDCKQLAPGAAIDTVFIEGHTDRQGSETAAGDSRNWQLSTERAVETYRTLTAFEPSLRALRNPEKKEILSVSGYSSTRPIPGTEMQPQGAEITQQAWEKNRRIDMRFVMQVDPSDRLKDVLRLTDDMEGQIEKLREAATLR
ncbi:OmpA family protein [Rhizobium leguminosarum]|uniref:OmpA family protein n=1 Tax=Rhizobium leguminosarum TaxID=384 RepID=UPI001C97A49E|nr:OmpA family protein [Rhizobium leguminosarum]MBY5586540.1 OmpA family protein [Rhizobium leguminosarum]